MWLSILTDRQGLALRYAYLTFERSSIRQARQRSLSEVINQNFFKRLGRRFKVVEPTSKAFVHFSRFEPRIQIYLVSILRRCCSNMGCSKSGSWTNFRARISVKKSD
jgi:hypothetical protein